MTWGFLGQLATGVGAVLIYYLVVRESVKHDIQAEDNGEVWI